MELTDLDINKIEDRKKVFDIIEQHLMRGNFIALKRISNDFIELSALQNNKNLVYASYVPYLIYKILTQPHIVKNHNWQKNKRILLDYLNSLENKELPEYVDSVSKFCEYFSNVDREIYKYLKNNLEKAKVKQAARLYSHGFSIKRAIAFTDADILEFQHYLHNNKEHDLINFQDEISEKVNELKKVLM